MLDDNGKQKGHANRATLAVAHKLVARLVAADRRQKSSLQLKEKTVPPRSRAVGIQRVFLRRVARQGLPLKRPAEGAHAPDTPVDQF